MLCPDLRGIAEGGGGWWGQKQINEIDASWKTLERLDVKAGDHSGLVWLYTNGGVLEVFATIHNLQHGIFGVE